MQAIQLMMFGLVFGLMPNFAHAQPISPTIIVLSATLIFLMFLTVYVVYKIRRSLSAQADKTSD